MFALISPTGMVEALQAALPAGAQIATALPGWFDVSAANPVPQPGWVTADGGKTFADPRAPTLAQAQADRVGSLRAQCAAAITGPAGGAAFTSAALGAAHSYPGDSDSQANMLAGAVTGGSLWCEVGGAWALTAHTAAQAQQVVADWSAHRLAAQQQLASLLAQVSAATTVQTAQAIAWPVQ